MAISFEILKASGTKWNVEVKGSLRNAVKILSAHFVEKYGKENLVACPICKNEAPEYDDDKKLLDACPFCGAVFVATPAEETPIPIAAAETAAPEPGEEPEAEEAAPPVEDYTTEEPKRGRGRPKLSEEERAARKALKDQQAEAAGVKTKVVKKKGVKKAPGKEEEAMVPASPEQKAELEQHVSRINKLRAEMACNAWDIGCELNEIRNKSLWKGLGHTSFFGFCQSDLDFSRASAYKYMLISEKFEKETFLQLGVKKGEMILSAPEKFQSTLIKAAEKGASHTDLKTTLNKLEGKASKIKRNGEPTVPTTVGGEPVQKGPERKQITLLGRVKSGAIHIPWLSVQTHEAITDQEEKDKYARIQLTDDVEMIVVPEADGLGLVCNFRRAVYQDDVDTAGGNGQTAMFEGGESVDVTPVTEADEPVDEAFGE